MSSLLCSVEKKEKISFDECSYLIELIKHRINVEPKQEELDIWFKKTKATIIMLVEDMILPA